MLPFCQPSGEAHGLGDSFSASLAQPAPARTTTVNSSSSQQNCFG